MDRGPDVAQRMIRWSLVALGVGLTSLAAAPAALAAEVEVCNAFMGCGLRYGGTTGETNQVRLTGNATTIVIDDVVPITIRTPRDRPSDDFHGCEAAAADNTVVTCRYFGQVIPGALFRLNDLDDSLIIVDDLGVIPKVIGGPGADALTGGPGADYLEGDAGNDTVRGEGGADTLLGDCDGYDTCDGNDILAGGAGDDLFFADGGSDSYSGGPGFDTFGSETGTAAAPQPVTITLDGRANDGRSGEGDQVGSDVEDAFLFSAGGDSNADGFLDPAGPGTLVGSAGTNSLSGSDGNDTIDGAGGNDFLSGNSGDDTINSRDGFVDRIRCGLGSDTAKVDSLDEVSSDCETVDRVDVGGADDGEADGADEDRPPSVSWVAPAAGASLLTSGVNTLQVAAGDDRGVGKVQFIDDDRIVCEDTAAPYTCDYRPRAEDVGRNTLIAVAIDTSQQTASATRTVSVPRFDGQLSSQTQPGRDRRAPYRFITSGRLALPSAVSTAQGCEGRVAVQIKAGRKTVSNRRVRLSSDCTFESRVRFTLPRRLRPSRLRVFTTFLGNAAVNPDRAPARSVRGR